MAPGWVGLAKQRRPAMQAEPDDAKYGANSLKSFNPER